MHTSKPLGGLFQILPETTYNIEDYRFYNSYNKYISVSFFILNINAK